MAEIEPNIEKRLRHWLESQGYPLEMLVSTAFQEKGFRTIQSEYYTDPESGVMREIDVVASLQNRIQGIHLRVTFVIECKLSRDKPFVLFTSSKASIAAPAKVVQRAASGLGSALLRKLSKRIDIQEHPIFQVGKRPGYGLTQGFTSGQDIAYSAATNVAKSALALKIKADETNRTQFPACEIIFPILVIDGRLFECYLEENSDLSLSEIFSGILKWRNPLVGKPHTIIHIVTVTNLTDFVSKALDCVQLILGTCNAEIEQIVKEQNTAQFIVTKS